MEKLIIKFIYFLLKYVKSEITSFEQFKAEAAQLANGRYFSVVVGQTTASGGTSDSFDFKVYVDGFNWYTASSAEGAINKLKVAMNVEIPRDVNTLLD